MCLAVYLATASPLPLVPWDAERPAFYVSDSIAAHRDIQRHLTHTCLYYAGTHEGCGCGFIRDGVAPGSSEDAAVRSAYHALADYLRAHAAGQVEIYTCWGGDEGVAPESQRRIGVDALYDDRFVFAERERLVVDMTG